MSRTTLLVVAVVLAGVALLAMWHEQTEAAAAAGVAAGALAAAKRERERARDLASLEAGAAAVDAAVDRLDASGTAASEIEATAAAEVAGLSRDEKLRRLDALGDEGEGEA